MKQRWMLLIAAFAVLTMGASPTRSSGQNKTLKDAQKARQPISFNQRIQAQTAIDKFKYAHRVHPKDERAMDASFEAVVEGRLALEKIRWMYREWPELNKQTKPPFDAEGLRPIFRQRMEETLRMDSALQEMWNAGLTTADLQAEIDRMVQCSREPSVLHDYFAALGWDPSLVAECLVRPILVRNSIRSKYAMDPKIHAQLRAEAEQELASWKSPEDMAQTAGVRYTKAEIRKGKRPTDWPAIKSNSTWPIHWKSANAFDSKIQGIARQVLGSYAEERSLAAGDISPLQESEDGFYAIAVVDISEDRILTAKVEWLKPVFETWWRSVRTRFAPAPLMGATRDALPLFHDTRATTAEQWSHTNLTGAPTARSKHIAVWTGSEMIVWGGEASSGAVQSGGLYDPATDTWVATSTGTDVPSARWGHTAIWTGSEMIVWGGWDGTSYFNTGGRYDPSSNSWTATPTTDAPTARRDHTAVWTGSKMIAWGGYFNDGSSHYLNTGSYYTPGGAWTATNTFNSPSGREDHSAVYSNSGGMMIWGGYGNFGFFNTGARYDEGTDKWVALGTSSPPSAREGHSAVYNIEHTFTIFGGISSGSGTFSNGFILNSDFTNWTALPSSNRPAKRWGHTAVRSGFDMIIWGGEDDNISASCYNDGGRWEEGTNSWIPIVNTLPNTPTARTWHTAVSTGGRGEMIVWGGETCQGDYLRNGGVYSFCSANVTAGTSASAVDADGCADTGVAITWNKDPQSWGGNDGVMRNYDVLRDSAPIALNLPYGTTSFNDTDGANGTTYGYSVRYNSGCGLSDTTPESEASDLTSTQPTVTATCTAEDSDGCTANSGITITWPQDPGGGWNDNDEGSRTYRVWRRDNVSGTWSTWSAIGSSVIAYGTTTYDDTNTVTGYLYKYMVRYINGCGKKDFTAATPQVQDATASNPTVTQTATATDASSCDYLGITVTWPVDPDNWGDSGTGDRYYRVRRSTDGVNFKPIGGNIPYPTHTYTDTGAIHDQLYYYQVRYKNGCTNYTDSGNDSAEDIADSSPCPVVDGSVRLTKADPNVQIDWDAVSCSDIKNYIVYASTDPSAPFPVQWFPLSSPTSSQATDTLTSTYKYYRVVTVDNCNNESN